MDGYFDRRYSCEIDQNSFEDNPQTLEVIRTDSDDYIDQCVLDTDCSEIENAYCNENGQCTCLEGFLPTYDGRQPMKLTWCKDPIVLTSTVGGYCLVPRHCSGIKHNMIIG